MPADRISLIGNDEMEILSQKYGIFNRYLWLRAYIVIDGRNDVSNPYMKIIFPELITNKEIREENIEVIQIYEYYRPSEWHRTNSSMRLQWFDHNIKYFLSHNLGKTVDVKFSNNQEKKYYNLRIFNRLFKL